MAVPSPAVQLLCCCLGGITWSSLVPMAVATPVQTHAVCDDLVAVVEPQLLMKHTWGWYRGITSSHLWIVAQVTRSVYSAMDQSCLWPMFGQRGLELCCVVVCCAIPPPGTQTRVCLFGVGTSIQSGGIWPVILPHPSFRPWTIRLHYFSGVTWREAQVTRLKQMGLQWWSVSRPWTARCCSPPLPANGSSWKQGAACPLLYITSEHMVSLLKHL